MLERVLRRQRWSLGRPVAGKSLVSRMPLLSLVLAISASDVSGQSIAELLAAGERESTARRPAQALEYFERAVSADPRNYVALWRSASELVDLGEYEKVIDTRTAMYARAVDFAKRAVAVKPNDAEGHFHLSRAIGRTALAQGPRERTKYGVAVRESAMRALELSPRHAGALHVMGVWNAEIMRLNGISRMVAKTFLGGKIFETASWSEAVRYMELSVAAEPDRLVHRLDLARVYQDTGRKADARIAFTAALNSALRDANDDRYRAEAERELKAMK
ncbi:MAG: hypothetical protein IT353_09970 [Gemmatimonadaceae bacterium]|nr:hypothetical protein [Gemmatimonadaceae bacterium]